MEKYVFKLFEKTLCQSYQLLSAIPFMCDSPEMYQTRLQDSCSTNMEGIFEFNHHLLFLILVIISLVGWLLFSTITNYEEFNVPKIKSFYHSDILEIVWTSIPALTLLTLAYPSYSLLYSMDEISVPDFAVKISGHQWFWSYEISDFHLLATCHDVDDSKKILKYTCYILTDEKIAQKNYNGFFRLLETNKRLILPGNTHLRLLVTSVDVLHSWAVPSLGIKIDACPGRLNQVNAFIKRFGVFFGQCSEICGVNHGFMPIALIVLPSNQYHFYVMSYLF